MAAPDRPPAAPLDTLLVAGLPGAGKTTLISGWLAERPARERWAVLIDETGVPGLGRARREPPASTAAVEVARIAAGCACCAGRVAFDVALARLLRRGPWDRLLVETGGLGHAAQVLDRLRAPGLGARLRVRAPVLVVDATRAGSRAVAAWPRHALAADLLALARLVVLNRSAGLAPADADALAAALAAAPPWPRAVRRTGTGRLPLADAIGALEAIDGGDAVDGGAAGRAGPPGSPAPPGRTVALVRRWPPSTPFDRAALTAALERLAGDGGPLRACGLLRGQGAFRTERAWYAWRWADGRAEWSETAWRADSRFEVLAQTVPDPQVVDDALRAAVGKG